MPVLSNPKHELFAQEVAKGTPLEKVYAVAGYKPDRKNAQRLTTKDDVRSRIDEILTQAAVKAGVSVERIVDELRDVAFASITDAVEWGEGIAVKNKRGAIQVVQAVVLKPCADLPPHVTAAISEVRKTKDGIVIKIHDKLAALRLLGQHLGMFAEKDEDKRGRTLEELIIASYELAREQDRKLALEAQKTIEGS